jgi:hypothetical protein
MAHLLADIHGACLDVENAIGKILHDSDGTLPDSRDTVANSLSNAAFRLHSLAAFLESFARRLDHGVIIREDYAYGGPPPYLPEHRASVGELNAACQAAEAAVTRLCAAPDPTQEII